MKTEIKEKIKEGIILLYVSGFFLLISIITSILKYLQI